MCEWFRREVWFRIGRIIIYYIQCIIYTYLQLQKNKSWTRVRLGSFKNYFLLCVFDPLFLAATLVAYQNIILTLVPSVQYLFKAYLPDSTSKYSRGCWFQTCWMFSYKIKNSCFPFLIWNSHKLLNYRWLRWYIPNEGGKIDDLDCPLKWWTRFHNLSKDHLKLEYPLAEKKAAVKFTSKVGLCLSIGSLFAGGTYVLPCFFCGNHWWSWEIHSRNATADVRIARCLRNLGYFVLARWVNHRVASVLWPISIIIYTSYHYYLCILHAAFFLIFLEQIALWLSWS